MYLWYVCMYEYMYVCMFVCMYVCNLCGLYLLHCGSVEKILHEISTEAPFLNNPSERVWLLICRHVRFLSSPLYVYFYRSA